MNQLTQPFSKIIGTVNMLSIPSAVFVTRLGWLPGNLSPVGSFGFFGRNIWLYLAVVVGFDLLVGGLYKGFLFTYLGFLMYPLLGKLAADRWKRQVLLLPLASLSFYLLSNLGVWWYWYPHTIDGLILCYTLALPFFARTIGGDIIFGYGYLLTKWFSGIMSNSKAYSTQRYAHTA